MTTTPATPVKPVKPVRVKGPGIGAAFSALWSAIITLLQGIEAYASAFKRVGEVADLTAANYLEEAKLLHEQEMESLRNEE